MEFPKNFKEEKIKLFYLALRRRFLFLFRKKYVQESVTLRKGGCRRCPCCHTPGLFSKKNHCQYLKGQSCLLFDAKLPLFCKLYPIDEKDKTPFGKTHCGYYWEKQDLKKLKGKYKLL